MRKGGTQGGTRGTVSVTGRSARGLADNEKNRREWERRHPVNARVALRQSNIDGMISANHGDRPNRNSFKVDIRSVLSDALRNSEYVAKGTTAQEGGEVPPDCVQKIFMKLNTDIGIARTNGGRR